MASLLERLQEALSPEYEVQQELAAGGMGIVFLARHLGLDRRVAIKVLAPELASSAAAQRFMREARILASLSHSHVIPIHQVGEADGLFYYVMDYIDGETLADALRRGPMGVEDVVKLGRDLLDALEAVHARDVVHRDVKPENIFLSGKRALLGDFGIAKQDSGSDLTLTQTGAVIGTPFYMPPEQLSGETVSERTDIYAVAMVLYEALTGRQWKTGSDPHGASWAGIPIGVARVLRGALAFAPTDRWPNATTFRKKLWGTRARRYQWRTAALTAAGILVGVTGAIIIIGPPSPSPTGAVVVKIEPFQQDGAASLGLAESLTEYVVGRLGQSGDFHVCQPNESCRKATVTLHGSVSVSDAVFSVQVKTQAIPGLSTTDYPSRVGRDEDWEAVADSILYDVVVERRLSENSELAELRNVLPKSIDGLNLWFDAERAFNEGRYRDAAEIYATAVQQDSTCLLCSWRLLEIGRQIPGPQDAELQKHVYSNKNSFPEWYQALIELDSLAESERIPYLERAVVQWPDAFYVRFRLGEEIFNRGPFWGKLRSEAIPHLEAALARRPGFAPALEHLAWAAIAEGDQENARRALDDLEALPPPTDPGYRVLIPIAYAYRFSSPEDGRDEAESALGVEGAEVLAPVVPRLMPGFDLPNAAIDLGRSFETASRGRNRWKLAGLMGQMFGYLAMGQVALARVHAGEIDGLGMFSDDFRLFAAQLDAFLTLFDAEATGLDRNEVMDELQVFVPEDAASSRSRKRAAWTLSLLHRQAGADSAADSMRELAGSPSDPLVILLDAHQLAAHGDFADALDRADPLSNWRGARFVSEGLVGPFFRTVVHLLRAKWFDATENPLAARRELRWHQAYDQDDLPLFEPRVEEVDWAFGTLARWRRAEVIERIRRDDPALCKLYSDIVRLWSGGDPVYAARAETEKQKLGELNCDAPTR